MELTQTDDAGRPVLAISGKCTVEHAAALRQALLAALAGGSLTLDVSRVEEVDVTFLQLLLATALTVAREGGTFGRIGALGDACRQAARASGFDQTPQLKTFFAEEDDDG